MGTEGSWGYGSLGVKTRKVLGKPGRAGVCMCVSPTRWPIKAFVFFLRFGTVLAGYTVFFFGEH